MDHVELDIDLNLPALSARGRKAAGFVASVVRPLENADIVMLATNRATQPIALKKLSQRHHGLARSLAAGLPPGEAALIHNYDLSRVSILQGDPAFSDLISFYREKVDVAFVEVAHQIAGLSQDVISELGDRLEQAPEDFSNKELITLNGDMLDRTGHGKQSTQVNVNTNLETRLTAARLRAKAAAMAIAEASIIDAEVIETAAIDITPNG